jgi:alpha-beta hydrolase superfamily lysophospholipase
MEEKQLNRRDFLRNALLAGGSMAVGAGLVKGIEFVGGSSPRSSALFGREQTWYNLKVIGDPLMDNRLLWYLGAAWQGMAEISECLDTASRIEAGNVSSWVSEWISTADRVRVMADASLAKDHRLSAGETYLRAANYYRAGLIYIDDPSHPDMLRATEQSVESYEKALDLLSMPVTPVEIPYEGTTLPGYFFRSPIADEKAPLLIAFEGWDAWPEEVTYLGQSAIRRGYHCLLFHGPGQGRALRQQGLVYRPDWENVVTPVVDFALTQPGVDPDRLALMGISFGGALATRAVAFEKRIKLCIANPAVYSWWESLSGFLFSQQGGLDALLRENPEAFNTAMRQFGKLDPTYEWWINATQWKHGASSPAELMLMLQQFTNADIADRITCHVLIMDGEAEEFTAGQAKKMYDALTCPKDYMLFTKEDTGLMHCQTAALAVANQWMFDWLDENI